MEMDIEIRKVRKGDFEETEILTREGFWDLYKPGCDEHLILNKIREGRCYIPELDLVILLNQSIVGHVICTRAKVIDSNGLEHELLCAGPFSIEKQFQNQGYGTKLFQHCIERAKQLNYKGIVLFGAPEYYHRFGFKNSIEFGITTKDGENFEPFMTLEMSSGGLKEIKGRFFEDELYTTDKDELTAFEKRFPHKEKHVLPTQLHI
jgi:predicted N-acetyltransferase YhbS